MDTGDDIIARLLQWGLQDDAADSRSNEATVTSESSESDGGDETTARRRQSLSRRRVYSNREKLEAVDAVKAGGKVVAVAAALKIRCHSSITAWMKQESALRAAVKKQRGSHVTLGGQGRRPHFQHEDELRQWIKDIRREDFPLKTSHVVQYLTEEYRSWTTEYLASRRPSSLDRLVRRMVHRQGFSYRNSSRSILSLEEMLQEQVEFTTSVAANVASIYPRGAIYNSDETAVYYDDSPGRIIAERGARKSTKVKGKKQSYRATVLLTIAADGTKLPPLIIFKAKPGGTVEDAFDEYPNGAVYAVQSNAWMDASVWRDSFINMLWEDHVYEQERGPLALYVDNFRAHVSAESVAALAELGTELVPLPTNTTAMLQPLDVGIMGPFKKKLRSLALASELEMMRDGQSTPLRERLLALRKLSADTKRKLIASRVIEAWDSVSEATIRNAWVKSKLVSANDQ